MRDFVRDRGGDRWRLRGACLPPIRLNKVTSASGDRTLRAPLVIHTRGVAGSIPAAPIRKDLVIRLFLVRLCSSPRTRMACQIRARSRRLGRRIPAVYLAQPNAVSACPSNAPGSHRRARQVAKFAPRACLREDPAKPLCFATHTIVPGEHTPDVRSRRRHPTVCAVGNSRPSSFRTVTGCSPSPFPS